MEKTINVNFIFPNTGFYLSDVDLFFRRAMGMEGAVHLVYKSMEKRLERYWIAM